MGDLVDGSARSVQPVMIEGRSMAVLYGSETGGAEDIAIELGQMAERLHFRTTVDEMDGYKLVRRLPPGADFFWLLAFWRYGFRRALGRSLTLRLRTGRRSPRLAGRLCHVNDGPGRHAKEHAQVLEESQA